MSMVDEAAEETCRDVIARTLGFRQPTQGLLGSGLERMLAFQRATDIIDALGLPRDLPADVLRRFGSGEVIHLGPEHFGR